MLPAGTGRTGDALSGNGDQHAVRLTIPAKAEYIMLGRLALTSFAHLRPFLDEELSDVKLALTEACTNSVRHAYHDAAGVVEILYELHPDRLIVEVSDNGEGFVPSSDRDSNPEELAEGGLGLEIIRAVSDALEIEEPSGGGSRLRFVKLLRG